MTLACFIAALELFCQFTLHVRRVAPAIPTNLQLQYPAASWQVGFIRAFDGVRLDSWFLRPTARNGNCAMVLRHRRYAARGAGYAPLFLEEGYSVLLPDNERTAPAGRWSPTVCWRSPTFSPGPIGCGSRTAKRSTLGELWAAPCWSQWRAWYRFSRIVAESPLRTSRNRRSRVRQMFHLRHQQSMIPSLRCQIPDLCEISLRH